VISPTLIDSDIEDLPAGIRVVAGIFQSTAVRAAGFGIVPLNSLAPAVKVLYVIMRKSSAKPIVFMRLLLIAVF
jgi:Trk-type K+ transport system membrane component